MMKKVISIVCAVAMLVSMISLSAIVASAEDKANFTITLYDNAGNKIEDTSSIDFGSSFWVAVGLDNYENLIGESNFVRDESETIDEVNTTLDRTVAIATSYINLDPSAVSLVMKKGNVEWSTPHEDAEYWDASLSINPDISSGVFRATFYSDNNGGYNYSLSKSDLDAKDGELFRVHMKARAAGTDETYATANFSLNPGTATAAASVAMVYKPEVGTDKDVKSLDMSWPDTVTKLNIGTIPSESSEDASSEDASSEDDGIIEITETAPFGTPLVAADWTGNTDKITSTGTFYFSGDGKITTANQYKIADKFEVTAGTGWGNNNNRYGENISVTVGDLVLSVANHKNGSGETPSQNAKIDVLVGDTVIGTIDLGDYTACGSGNMKTPSGESVTAEQLKHVGGILTAVVDNVAKTVDVKYVYNWGRTTVEDSFSYTDALDLSAFNISLYTKNNWQPKGISSLNIVPLASSESSEAESSEAESSEAESSEAESSEAESSEAESSEAESSEAESSEAESSEAESSEAESSEAESSEAESSEAESSEAESSEAESSEAESSEAPAENLTSWDKAFAAEDWTGNATFTEGVDKIHGGAYSFKVTSVNKFDLGDSFTAGMTYTLKAYNGKNFTGDIGYGYIRIGDMELRIESTDVGPEGEGSTKYSIKKQTAKLYKFNANGETVLVKSSEEFGFSGKSVYSLSFDKGNIVVSRATATAETPVQVLSISASEFGNYDFTDVTIGLGSTEIYKDQAISSFYVKSESSSESSDVESSGETSSEDASSGAESSEAESSEAESSEAEKYMTSWEKEFVADDWTGTGRFVEGVDKVDGKGNGETAYSFNATNVNKFDFGDSFNASMTYSLLAYNGKNFVGDIGYGYIRIGDMELRIESTDVGPEGEGSTKYSIKKQTAKLYKYDADGKAVLVKAGEEVAFSGKGVYSLSFDKGAVKVTRGTEVILQVTADEYGDYNFKGVEVVLGSTEIYKNAAISALSIKPLAGENTNGGGKPVGETLTAPWINENLVVEEWEDYNGGNDKVGVWIKDGKLTPSGNGTAAIQSKKSFNLGESFELAVNFKIKNGYNNFYGEYSSMGIGDKLELRIYNVKGEPLFVAKLYYNGTEIASTDLASPDGVFTMSFNSGKITVKQGDMVMNWKTASGSSVSTVTITGYDFSNEKVVLKCSGNYGPRYMTSISLKTANSGASGSTSTGDNSNVFAIVLLMMVAAAGVVLTMKKSKRA